MSLITTTILGTKPQSFELSDLSKIEWSSNWKELQSFKYTKNVRWTIIYE